MSPSVRVPTVSVGGANASRICARRRFGVEAIDRGVPILVPSLAAPGSRLSPSRSAKAAKWCNMHILSSDRPAMTNRLPDWSRARALPELNFEPPRSRGQRGLLALGNSRLLQGCDSTGSWKQRADHMILAEAKTSKKKTSARRAISAPRILRVTKRRILGSHLCLCPPEASKILSRIAALSPQSHLQKFPFFDIRSRNFLGRLYYDRLIPIIISGLSFRYAFGMSILS